MAFVMLTGCGYTWRAERHEHDVEIGYKILEGRPMHPMSYKKQLDICVVQTTHDPRMATTTSSLRTSRVSTHSLHAPNQCHEPVLISRDEALRVRDHLAKLQQQFQLDPTQPACTTNLPLRRAYSRSASDNPSSHTQTTHTGNKTADHRTPRRRRE